MAINRWIKSGMAVVQITNLNKIYTVEKVVYKSIDTKEGRKSNIVGVECSYVNDECKKCIEMFHSRNLIPVDIAQKGILEAYSFYNKENKYKNYPNEK